MLPAASVARTLKLCLPFFSRFSFFGDPHPFHLFLSSLHSKVELGSEDLNLNLTLVLSVFLGAPLVILVFGWCGVDAQRPPRRRWDPLAPLMKLGSTLVPSRLARPIVSVPAFAQ